MTWAMLVPRRRTNFPWIEKRAAKFIDPLGQNSVTLRCDKEPAIEALEREAILPRRDHQWVNASPMGSPSVQWDSWLARPEH